MPSLDDLEPLLRSLWNNKPPGVAKSKIETATAIAAENVQVSHQQLRFVPSIILSQTLIGCVVSSSPKPPWFSRSRITMRTPLPLTNSASSTS